MPPTTLKTMPRSTTTIHAPAADNISLGEFIVDEDEEHFNSTLWQTFDQNAFILQQRDALEAFNVEKALRLSKETAAAEQQRRQTAAITAPAAGIPSSNPSSSRHVSQPIAIKKGTPHPLYPSSSPAKPIKFSPSSSSSSYHLQDKKASASIAKQHSRNQLSLSTSSFPNSSFPSPSAAVDSRHSRSTSQSNTLTKAPSLLLSPSIAPPVANQRTISKREPGVSDEPTRSIPSSQTSDATHPKRRRTEGKPSISSPPVDVVVSAPPLSAPQKSSRTLRPGTIIASTKDNSSSSMSTSEGSKSHPPSKPKPNTAPKQKAYLHNPFSDIQTCPRCGNRSTRNQLSTSLNSGSLCDALHFTCSSCMTRYCRGCTSISPCTRPCSAGQSPTSCPVRNCCYNVRAVVIFEALNVFDHVFATEAGFTTTSTTTTTADPADLDPHQSFHAGRQQRDAYIKLLISKADKGKFEDAFVRTLRVICSWLQFSPVDADADDKTASGNPSVLNSSVLHLLASYLPEVIHTFLNNNNVRDWIAHSETYSMILETLRWISNSPTLSHVLNLPLPPVQRNCSLRRWETGEGVITFLEDAKRPVGVVVAEIEPIGHLIRKLEMHRGELMGFAGKIQFGSTKEKVNVLCDGISYLVLQQVAG